MLASRALLTPLAGCPASPLGLGGDHLPLDVSRVAKATATNPFMEPEAEYSTPASQGGSGLALVSAARAEDMGGALSCAVIVSAEYTSAHELSDTRKPPERSLIR